MTRRGMHTTRCATCSPTTLSANPIALEPLPPLEPQLPLILGILGITIGLVNIVAGTIGKRALEEVPWRR